jgi:hypothetical protein
MVKFDDCLQYIHLGVSPAGAVFMILLIMLLTAAVEGALDSGNELN